MNQHISNLRPTIIVHEASCVEIYHELVCSMIDEHICHALTETKSRQTCFVCNATPTQMNKLGIVNQRQNCTEHYKYGLSTLHVWIRFLECALHISYNMSAHKKLRKERKENIQRDFREKTVLLIEIVKQGKTFLV